MTLSPNPFALEVKQRMTTAAFTFYKRPIESTLDAVQIENRM